MAVKAMVINIRPIAVLAILILLAIEQLLFSIKQQSFIFNHKNN